MGKRRKSIFKKWWFWIIVFFILAIPSSYFFLFSNTYEKLSCESKTGYDYSCLERVASSNCNSFFSGEDCCKIDDVKVELKYSGHDLTCSSSSKTGEEGEKVFTGFRPIINCKHQNIAENNFNSWILSFTDEQLLNCKN